MSLLPISDLFTVLFFFFGFLEFSLGGYLLSSSLWTSSELTCRSGVGNASLVHRLRPRLFWLIYAFYVLNRRFPPSCLSLTPPLLPRGVSAPPVSPISPDPLITGASFVRIFNISAAFHGFFPPWSKALGRQAGDYFFFPHRLPPLHVFSPIFLQTSSSENICRPSPNPGASLLLLRFYLKHLRMRASFFPPLPCLPSFSFPGILTSRGSPLY